MIRQGESLSASPFGSHAVRRATVENGTQLFLLDFFMGSTEAATGDPAYHFPVLPLKAASACLYGMKQQIPRLRLAPLGMTIAINPTQSISSRMKRSVEWRSSPTNR